MAADPVTIVHAREALGARLAALRTTADHTQTSFSRLTFYGRSSIANIETGRQNAPRHFWELCDEILKTGGALTQEHDRLSATRREHQLQAVDRVDGAEIAVLPGRGRQTGVPIAGPRVAELPDAYPGTPAVGQIDDVVDVLARVQKLNRTVDPTIIDHLRGGMQYTLTHYDAANHGRLGATLVKQRAWLDTLLDDCPHPRQRQQLFEVATWTSGLLGYLAVGKASFGLARAYCLEAFHLAALTQDANQLGWARGMQSFCEYYAGDYTAALQLALDGVARVGHGPQNVRLMINGAARAAGKLGDAEGVRRAVATAYDLMASHQAPVGVPSSIDLGCYSPAQVAGNAATAFLSLGMSREVQQYVELAMPEVRQSASPWSRSLVTLDLASSLIRSSDNDLDRATDLVLDALAVSQGRPIVSVRQRTQEFVRDAAGRWGNLQQVRSVREALAAMEDSR